jgi:hypothetical protein
MLIIDRCGCVSSKRLTVHSMQTAFFGMQSFGMQSSCLPALKRVAIQFICMIWVAACIAGPLYARFDNRPSDHPQSAVTSVTQSVHDDCEPADCKSAAQVVRWNIKPEFLSRSLVVVQHQHTLCINAHPLGNLRREFSHPSLFAMGISLRL